MPAPATSAAISPEIVEAANLAAGLITRTLKLVERSVAHQEQTPTPDLKEAASIITTIKRAADTLKVLAPLQSPNPDASASPKSPAVPAPASTPITSAVDDPELAEALAELDSLHTSLRGLLPSPKSSPSPRQPKPPQPPSTRRYGEMLSRR